MADIIVTILLIIIVGLACRYIWKARKAGNHCIGCANAGSCSATDKSRCNCNK